MDLEILEARIKKIEDRNNRVTAEKGWETSWTRIITLAALTYIVIGLFLSFIKVGWPWLNALVPALGFFFSTLSMPFFRKHWIDKWLNDNK